MKKDIYSQKEVLKLLQISNETLLKEIEAGKLSFFWVGERRRFTQKNIDEYIEVSTNETPN